MTSEKRTDRYGDHFSDYHRERQRENRAPVLHQRDRIDHHADRNKEYRGEHVAHWPHEILDLDLVPRFGYKRSRDESTQRYRVAERQREKRRREANANARDQRGLRLPQSLYSANRARNGKYSKSDQRSQEHHQAYCRNREIAGRNSPRSGNRRQDGKQENRDQIFDDENSEDELGYPSLDVLLLERFHNDRGAGNSCYRPRKDALHPGEAEHLSDKVSDGHHDAALEQRHRACLLTHLHQLPDAEFEPEREHQQDDSQLGESAHRLRIGDEGNR